MKTKSPTSLGKITILKSLNLIKLFYKLSILPTEIRPIFMKCLNAFNYGSIYCKLQVLQNKAMKMIEG